MSQILRHIPDSVETVERYRRLYTGVVYDVLDELGLPNQVLATDVRPILPQMIVAGPAFTVQGINDPTGDPELRDKRIKMFGAMSSPCVDVRDCGFDQRVAHYGEMNAVLGRAKGAVGAIVDGGVRDSRHLIEMNFPVFRRYHSPVEAIQRWSYFRWQQPISLRGAMSATVTVHPGDFVLGDIDGVVIIPKELTYEVLRKSEEIASVEDSARKDFADTDLDTEEVYAKYRKL